MSKKTILLCALIVTAFFSSCSHSTQESRLIVPLPSGIDLENIQDCTIPAAFSPIDFDWNHGKLTLTAYNMDLYDVVDISQMKVGDTIFFDHNKHLVSQIDTLSEGFDINGGIENGGCSLKAHEGGTYRGLSCDDHATYTKLGSIQIPISDTFTIIDCGLNPQDPYDTIRLNQKTYIQNLKDSRPDFHPLNTIVTIQNGSVTEITRRWIP